MKKTVVLNVSKRNTDVMSFVEKKIKNYHFEQVSEVENAIEKMQMLPVKIVLIDTEFSIEDKDKIEKLGKLFVENLQVGRVDFANKELYLETFENLKKVMVRNTIRNNYQIEDNPNLNNPFLNMSACDLKKFEKN